LKFKLLDQRTICTIHCTIWTSPCPRKNFLVRNGG